MNKTASGSPITLTVLHAYADEAIDVTSIKYNVFDATGAALGSETTVAPGTDGQTEVTIPATLNNTTSKYDIRSVEFMLITAGGSYKVTQFYEVVGDALKLTPWVDSFMTFPESILVERRLSANTQYYDALGDEDKAVALENAYARLSALRFTAYGVLADLTPDTAPTDAKFLEALKKAQIIEANAILENNPVREKIRMGIISETIGESSMFFRQSVDSATTAYPGVSDDAYPLLSKYLYKETSNAQIWKLRRS